MKFINGFLFLLCDAQKILVRTCGVGHNAKRTNRVRFRFVSSTLLLWCGFSAAHRAAFFLPKEEVFALVLDRGWMSWIESTTFLISAPYFSGRHSHENVFR